MPKISIFISTLLIAVSMIAGCTLNSDVNSSSNVQPAVDEMELTATSYDPDKPYTPSDVVANYFYALQEKNLKVAKQYLSKEATSKQKDDPFTSLGESLNSSNLQIVFERKIDKHAKVDYLITGVGNESLNKDVIYLISENGKWKISFDQPSPNPFTSTSENATEKIQNNGKLKE